MSEWLKTTIPGIVLLGALGSALAYFISKPIGWLLRKLALRLLGTAVVFNLRPFMVAWLQTSRYVQRKEDSKLVVLAMFLVCGFFLSSGLLIFFGAATVLRRCSLGSIVHSCIAGTLVGPGGVEPPT